MNEYYKKLNLNNLDKIRNPFLAELARRCILQNKLYLYNMKEKFNLDAAEDTHYGISRKDRVDQLRRMGVRVRNYGRSLFINRISYGCLSCTHWYKNGYLADVSQACNRKCFFCYSGIFPEKTGIPFSKVKKKIYDLYKNGNRKLLSIGNSEPLLTPERVFAILKLVRKLTNGKCYTFLYTNGDLLTIDILKKLKENMLNEIRISIKPGERNLKPLVLSKDYIPNVMVEIPIFPGDEGNAEALLVELNKLEIFGINLSQLLCTVQNRENLKARGFKIVTDKFKPFYESFAPYEVSVHGSEEACFNLLEFAVDKRLKIGVHYCSNANFRTPILNGRISHARAVRKPYELVTKYGLLKKIVIYYPDYVVAYRDLKKHGIPDQQIHVCADKKRLETHVSNLCFLNVDKYEIGVLYTLPNRQEVKIKVLGCA